MGIHADWGVGAGILPLRNRIYLRPNRCCIKRKVLSFQDGFENGVLNRVSVRPCEGRDSAGPLAAWQSTANLGLCSDPGVNAMWKSSITSDSGIHLSCFYILKGFEINGTYTSRRVTHLVPAYMCVYL